MNTRNKARPLDAESFLDTASLPFTRNPEAARATTEAIMASVRGSKGRQRVWRIAPRARRIVSLAVAAALIAALSSVLTFSYLRASGLVDVRFVLVAPEASCVHLAADFNRWSPEGYEMKRNDDGSWEITVPLRKGRAYAYNFIIDGERWIADPSSAQVLDDGFGGSSSSISL